MAETIRRNGPGNPRAATSTPPSADIDYTAGHDKFRQLWSRRAKLDCGCLDQCRCDYRDNPTPKRTDAYKDAIEHLAEQGLLAGALTPELRQLWRRGGSDRQVAETIVRRWVA